LFTASIPLKANINNFEFLPHLADYENERGREKIHRETLSFMHGMKTASGSYVMRGACMHFLLLISAMAVMINCRSERSDVTSRQIRRNLKNSLSTEAMKSHLLLITRRSLSTKQPSERASEQMEEASIFYARDSTNTLFEQKQER
jgi:hypothetical protein